MTARSRRRRWGWRGCLLRSGAAAGTPEARSENRRGFAAVLTWGFTVCPHTSMGLSSSPGSTICSRRPTWRRGQPGQHSSCGGRVEADRADTRQLWVGQHTLVWRPKAWPSYAGWSHHDRVCWGRCRWRAGWGAQLGHGEEATQRGSPMRDSERARVRSRCAVGNCPLADSWREERLARPFHVKHRLGTEPCRGRSPCQTFG